MLLVSADLNEVMELSDSLIVMQGGHIAAYFEDTKELTDDQMGEYMLGPVSYTHLFTLSWLLTKGMQEQEAFCIRIREGRLFVMDELIPSCTVLSLSLIHISFKKLRGKGRLSESDVKEAMREIRLALLEADVSYKVVKDFIKKTTERAVGADVLESLTPAQMIVKIVNEELTALMGSDNQKIHMASQPPTIVMLVGLQGAGKTTNGAKLAGLFKKQNKNPLLVACDIYRPAAIKQLQVVGGQLDIPVFEMGQTNPVDIAKAAVAHAIRHGNDMVFLDTAGRLHVDERCV